MDFDALLEARRSIRQYAPGHDVTEAQIEEIVAAAVQAPSWKNSQTARYYAVLSAPLRERFARECLPEGNAGKSRNAALVVTTFVANTAGLNTEGQPDNECGNGWGFYDLGLHNALFLLKAQELGLGTLVMGLRNADAIRSMLHIPESETIVSVIAVGTAAQSPSKPPRKAVRDILTFY